MNDDAMMEVDNNDDYDEYDDDDDDDDDDPSSLVELLSSCFFTTPGSKHKLGMRES